MKKGFSLIEIIITIGILGLMILVFQAVLVNGVLTRNAQNKDVALKIATHKIEEIRALGYLSVPASGSFTDSLLNTIPAGNATLTVSDYNTKVKQVVVTVSWAEPNSNPRSLSLTTLIADAGGL